MSTPSSNVEVATMTVSPDSAKACSLRRRWSADSDEWERCVWTPLSRSWKASCSALRRDSRNTRRFSPRWILLITVASGVAYTATRLFTDVKSGIFERFRAMPLARASALWAHVLTSVVANLVAVAIVVGVALLMGFRTSAGPTAWLGVGGILTLFTLTLTWIAVVAGLGAKSVEGAGAFSYPLIFLPFISSAFVPTESMPGPVRWFAEHQPVTAIVDAIRSLFAGQHVGGDIWTAVAWCVGILTVACVLALRRYRRALA